MGISKNCPRDMFACGILFCYNEEQIIGETVKFYLQQGIDLVVVDNCSTDESMNIVKKHRDIGDEYAGKIKDIIHVKTEGYEWAKILRAACDYMHERLSHYSWILLIDADAFYFSPVKNKSLVDFIKTLDSFNYNIIEGRLYEFYPTEKDNFVIQSPLERMKYYRILENGVYSNIHQQKIFKYHPSIDFYSTGGDVCGRKSPRIFNSPKSIYKHYPWISYEHGLDKIFKSRIPRYVERKNSPSRHINWHYLPLLPLKKDLIKESKKLSYFENNKILISPYRFFLEILFTNSAKKFILFFVTLLFRIIRKIIVLMLGKVRYATISSFFNDMLFKNRKQRNAPHEFEEIYVRRFPVRYDFLVTNYCNADCIFCNQIFNGCTKNELSLEKFKTICRNIPVESAKIFSFTGGGEPLLGKDIFAITAYVNEQFPWIEVYLRTNGLLIEKYAKELAQTNISRLEISLHGTENLNDYILQRRGTEDIFRGVKLLNNLLSNQNKKIHTSFYASVSRININDVPKLIKKAAELKIDEVQVFFCRYYQHKLAQNQGKLKAEDSLYFHKEIYDKIIKESQELAESMSIEFQHEPLFSGGFRERPCCCPWTSILIDGGGDIYPCGGGETAFREKVKSGGYHFGNLLEEHLCQCWNNQYFIMLRRTCHPEYNEDLVPECKNCHNILCLKGPNLKAGHILQQI